MHIAVIGVGGVGGYFGGLLARAGERVTFVARGEQYDALKSGGLTVKSVEGEFSLRPVTVLSSISELSDLDLVLVATKTYHRDDVARELAKVVGPETIVIPLLNGIDNAERIREILPVGRVVPGLAYIISARTAPGVIEQTAGPRTLIFGDPQHPSDPRLLEIEHRMKAAGVLATCSPSIERELWSKFLWIVTFAGMTSLCRAPIGAIVNDERAHALLLRCFDEAVAVAEASGVSVGPNPRAETIKKMENYRTTGSHAKASMLVDIEHGRPTEIEALNGKIVQLAEEFRIQVPIHESIYTAVRLATTLGRTLGSGN